MRKPGVTGFRLDDDKPMELNYVYIPVKLCPELARRDVESSLYAYIAAGKTTFTTKMQ